MACEIVLDLGLEGWYLEICAWGTAHTEKLSLLVQHARETIPSWYACVWNLVLITGIMKMCLTCDRPYLLSVSRGF